MENLDELYQWLHDEGVYLFDRQLPFSHDESKAVTIQLDEVDAWGIFLDKGRLETTAEEASAVFHEGGHYATGTTHKVCSPYDLVEKHENQANRWAIKRKLSAEDLDQAVADGYTELWSLAEHFCVTEDFMQKIICWYVHGNLDVERYWSF